MSGYNQVLNALLENEETEIQAKKEKARKKHRGKQLLAEGAATIAGVSGLIALNNEANADFTHVKSFVQKMTTSKKGAPSHQEQIDQGYVIPVKPSKPLVPFKEPIVSKEQYPGLKSILSTAIIDAKINHELSLIHNNDIDDASLVNGWSAQSEKAIRDSADICPLEVIKDLIRNPPTDFKIPQELSHKKVEITEAVKKHCQEELLEYVITRQGGKLNVPSR